MKVKCIDNKYFEKYLTIGEIYDVISIDHEGDYKLCDNYGEQGYYYKYRFKPLSEIRNEKIDKLLGL